MGNMIDIASWQHSTNEPIDWAQVKKAGYVGVLIKANPIDQLYEPLVSGGRRRCSLALDC